MKPHHHVKVADHVRQVIVIAVEKFLFIIFLLCYVFTCVFLVDLVSPVMLIGCLCGLCLQ